MEKYTQEQLNDFSKQQIISMFCALQDQLERTNQNLEKLIEQIRLDQQNRFGRKTEQITQISGQMSLFNEAEEMADSDVPEPDADEITVKVVIEKKPKQKGRREEDLKDLPQKEIHHALTDERLDQFFGKGCWRRMKPDEFTKVTCQPATFTAEKHTVDVAVGTDGDHQDEFLRGDRPKDLLKNSVATPSLVAAVLNAKYLNAMPLYRIEKQFQMNGVNIPRQNMANWTIAVSRKYLQAVRDLMKEELIHNDEKVIQADETTCQVIHDNDPDDPDDKKGAPGHKNYMWVYRTGEFNRERPIVIYDYQRTRHHKHPEEFLKDFNGILETDGLQQYHILDNSMDGITNANCWVHARRNFADAIKSLGKDNKKKVRSTIAYQALARIAAMYKIEETLRDLSAEERLKERQKQLTPLVDEFFAWVKQCVGDTTVLPRGKTAEGLNYCIDKEKYLRIFLTNGHVPMDNSASERAIRPFTIGRKNWVVIDSVRGAQSSAVIYSIVETAKLNNLNVFCYLEHLLTELPKLTDKEGMIDTSNLEPLLPWSDQLPEKCHKPRR